VYDFGIWNIDLDNILVKYLLQKTVIINIKTKKIIDLCEEKFKRMEVQIISNNSRSELTGKGGFKRFSHYIKSSHSPHGHE